MVRITLENLTKRFGSVIAVDNVSVDIGDGSFFALLGPSGCGKTTTLRLIAGFEMPTKGRIYFDGADVTDLPPYKRETGMVFQNYALWPHMTVEENIAYGLKIRKLPKSEIKKRVREVLRLVKLEGFENRYPSQLSGGQQQRIALARAIAVRPKTLLLDEPLSNLDAKLRIETRAELRRIQRELGITTVYVTHDQEEAMSISDRIAVMNQGRIMQIGTPQEIYQRPRNTFVADFIGQATMVEGKVSDSDGRVRVETAIGVLEGVPSRDDANLTVGSKVVVSMRPEYFTLKPEGDVNNIRAVIDHVAFIGKSQRLYCNSEGHRIIAELPPYVRLRIGEKVTLYIKKENTLIIPL